MVSHKILDSANMADTDKRKGPRKRRGSPKLPVQILDDSRTIKAVYRGETHEMYVGKALVNGGEIVTQIIAYGEPGEYCLKPWVAVYVGGLITQRIPCWQIMLEYFTPEEIGDQLKRKYNG